MKKDEKKFFSKISDGTKIKIIRWWSAAAIYFFIGLGTSLGNQTTPYDLIFVLGIVTGLLNVFAVHPIIYSMFDVERKGKIMNKKYNERTIMEGVWYKLGEVLKCLLAAILVLIIYQFINVSLIALLNKPTNTVVLGVEPILYGVFFLCCYLGLDFLANLIKDLFEKIKNNKNSNNY